MSDIQGFVKFSLSCQKINRTKSVVLFVEGQKKYFRDDSRISCVTHNFALISEKHHDIKKHAHVAIQPFHLYL